MFLMMQGPEPTAEQIESMQSIMDYSEAALLIEDARQADSRPRVHPNGFIQLDLVVSDRQHRASDVRLHVWPEEGRIQKQATDNTIHDHVFDMHSRVLRGGIEQVLYELVMGSAWDGPWSQSLDQALPETHEIFVAKYSCRHSSELTPSGMRGHLRGYESRWIGEGDYYTQPAFTFHDSEVTLRPTVTLMTKTATHEGNPRVLVPIGMGLPDNDFDRLTVDSDELWEIIDESLEGVPNG